jgi:hypothetical protein
MGMVRVSDVMKEKVVENGKKIHWNSEFTSTKGVSICQVISLDFE